MGQLVNVCNLNYEKILKNINLNINANTFVAISGSNKCGRTTLIKILSGFLDDKETITLNNIYLNSINKTELYKKIGFVIPDIKEPFIFKTVEQELLFVLDNLGLDKEKKQLRYKEILSLFKLKNHTQTDPNCLYLFFRIKMLLALAVIHHPVIVFLDDICSMLTKEETREILMILKKLQQEEGLTIVMTTDNLEEVLVSDYLYLLDHGKIVIEGAPLKVLQEDSMINKMGLTLPFMVDLSVKLQYYGLLDDIELDMDRLVNTLWK